MTSQSLHGKTIAIVATNGFEQSELLEPKRLLEAAGAKVEVLATASGHIKGWSKKNWGEDVKVDLVVDHADTKDYDALVIPGGVMNPDALRTYRPAVDFIRNFAKTGKPVAAICHGPWMLIEADLVRGKKVTSWPSLATDLKNSGAHWQDTPVVRDGNLITSRKPEDIPVFVDALTAMLTSDVEPQRMES